MRCLLYMRSGSVLALFVLGSSLQTAKACARALQDAIMRSETLSTNTIRLNPKLDRFLTEHSLIIRDFRGLAPLTPEEILGVSASQARLTQFTAGRDTQQYGRLIAAALRDSPEINRVVDLGCGSNLPTLLAHLELPDRIFDIIGVDIDPASVEIGRQNIEVFGRASSYRFEIADMASYLAKLSLAELQAQNSLVASNPPYLPIPKSITSDDFLPVNGGTDGTRYLTEILNQPYPPGKLLAIEWSTLSDPLELIDMIEKKYEILWQESAWVLGGKYSSHPEVFEHLQSQMRKQKAFFKSNPVNRPEYLMVSTLLRRKAS